MTNGQIWSKIVFYGDFEVVLDWRDFFVSDPGGLTTYHEFGLNVMDATDSVTVD